MRTLNFLPTFAIISIIFVITVWIIVSILSRFFNISQKIKILFFGFYSFLVLLFPTSFFLAQNINNYITAKLYFIGALSVGSIALNLYILIPSFIIAIISNKLLQKFAINKKEIIEKISKIIIIFSLVFINIFWIFNGFIPRVIEYDIDIEKNHNYHNKKIMIISDTHYWYIHSVMEAKNLVQKINELNPNIILVPGDFFDWPKINYQKIVDIFQNVKAPIFYVNGNHEEYNNTSEILQAISNSNIKILNDDTTLFDGISISGVTYHLNKTQNQLHSTLTSIAPKNNETINILMRHEPTLHDVILGYNYDIVVSGHTHRWQMWPFTYITDMIYWKYSYWLNKDKNMYSLTTSGVWSWGPPQRLGTRSEIIILNIK